MGFVNFFLFLVNVTLGVIAIRNTGEETWSTRSSFLAGGFCLLTAFLSKVPMGTSPMGAFLMGAGLLGFASYLLIRLLKGHWGAIERCVAWVALGGLGGFGLMLCIVAACR